MHVQLINLQRTVLHRKCLVFGIYYFSRPYYLLQYRQKYYFSYLVPKNNIKVERKL